MQPAVIATMTDIGFNADYKCARAACTGKTVQEAAAHGYQVVAVDAGSPPDYVEDMKRLGVKVYPQERPGMGNAQRQAMRLARELAGPDGVIIWTESEKYTLIPLLAEVVQRAIAGQFDLVMMHRRSLESYPPAQAKAYELMALAMRYLTGIDCDFGWGPMVLSPDAIEYFLSYVSSYEDTWDALHCPKLQLLAANRPWTNVLVDYRHPPELTRSEQTIKFLLKRVDQAHQLTHAMATEVARLGVW